MCKVCDHIASTKSPIQITCFWTETNRNSGITTDLSKCTIAIMDDSGRVAEEIPMIRCPVCGELLNKQDKNE